jgi:hypothetical protein
MGTSIQMRKGQRSTRIDETDRQKGQHKLDCNKCSHNSLACSSLNGFGMHIVSTQLYIELTF